MVLAVALPQGMRASTKTFDGGPGGTGTNLDVAANWVGDVLPATGDEVLLDNSVITLPATLSTLTTTNFGDLIVNSPTLNLIQVTSGTVAKTITLSGAGGSAAAIAAGGATGDLLLLGSAVHGTVTLGGGPSTGKLNFPLGTNGNFNVANADATLSIIGSLTGTFNINKTGAGTLIMSGVNSFGNGATTFTIGMGTMQLGATSFSLGSGANKVAVASGAVLDLNGKLFITANALTLNGTGLGNGGALINSSATAASYAGLVTLGSASSIVATSGNITLSHAGTITGSGLGLTVGGAFNTSIASIIGTGSGTLAKLGAGTLTLSGTNTFSGATTIGNGKIVMGNARALQNSAYDTTGSTGTIGLDVTGYTSPILGGLAGGVGLATAITGYGAVTNLVLNPPASITVTYSGVIADGSGSMTLTKTGAGTQVLSGPNTYSGGTAVSAGVLSIADTNALPGWDTTGRYAVASNATVAVGNAVTDDNIATLLGATNFAAGAAIGFDTTSGDRTYSANVGDTPSGALGLVKVGTNTLIFTGAKTYTGVTTVNAGTLQIGDGASNGSIAGASIVNNANLVYKLNGSDMTVSNLISGAGAFIKSGAGKLTFSAAQPYTGSTTVNGGVLIFNDAPHSAVFNINGASELDLNLYNVPFQNRTYVFDSTGGGTISADYPRVNGGTITTSGGARDSLIGSWKVETAGFTFNVARGTDPTSDLMVSAVVGFNGPLVKTGAGILTLSGANSFGSGMQLQQGGLVIGHATALGNNASRFTISNGTTLDGSNIRITNTNPEIWAGDFTYTGNSGTLDLGTGTVDLGSVPHTVTVSNQTLTVGGVISGSGSLTKAGAGTLVLSGTNTYSGATVVSNGVLRLTQSQCLGTNAVVYLYSGATNDLAFTGTLTIDSLYMDGVRVAAGTWGSTSSSAARKNNTYFSGTGVLSPLNGASAQGFVLIVK